MEQKRVSFEVAKAIKEAGYPQESNSCNVYPIEDIHIATGVIFHKGILRNNGAYCKQEQIVCAPTYLDVHLWLWREKRIAIPTNYFGYENNYWESCVPIGNDKFEFFSKMKDPEEAIIAAIEYLVTNNLIK